MRPVICEVSVAQREKELLAALRAPERSIGLDLVAEESGPGSTPAPSRMTGPTSGGRVWGAARALTAVNETIVVSAI